MIVKLTAKPDQSIGGGFTFAGTISRYLQKNGVQVVYDGDRYDVLFIVGPTTCSKDEFREAKAKKKPILLRTDNIPEDYRNRGTAISRLREFVQDADVVVYQSQWAKKYVQTVAGERDGVVIYNGAQGDIFNTDRASRSEYSFLYVRSSTNENKRWAEAKYIFHEIAAKHPSAKLTIVGNFSDYEKQYPGFTTQYRFGMFPNEQFEYKGMIGDPHQMAALYKSHQVLIAPYYNDACSNVIIEARKCGMVICMGTAAFSGANGEITTEPIEHLDAEYMGEQYLGILKIMAGA